VKRLSLEDYMDNPLWTILVETVQKMIMYPHHKAYVRSEILREHPDISYQELAAYLEISRGEALVILYELKKENTE
jgi:hypothetical protein